MNESTDLSNTVIDNTYYSMNADNGDGYDATEQAIVLNSRTQRDRPAVFTKKIPIKKEKEKKIRLLCILGQQLGILLLIPAIATINSCNCYY